MRILTNSAGTVTDSYIYTAFGVELLNGSGTINPFRYVGLYGYYMTFINLYYVRARWLDTVKGRWDSRDPIGFDMGSWNKFTYVNDAPLSAIDPAGLFSCSMCRSAFLLVTLTGLELFCILFCKPMQDCTSRQKRAIDQAKNEICRNVDAVALVDECISENCSLKDDRGKCISDWCNKQQDYKCGNCSGCAVTRGTPGHMQTMLRDKTIGGGPRDPSCSDLKCVLLHEAIHSCGVSHPDDQSLISGGTKLSNVTQDCKCFN